MKIEIIPAIQVKTFKKLQQRLDQVRGKVSRVQIDIVDSKFESNPSVAIEELAGANTSLVMDVQLMVQEPVRYLNRCDMIGMSRVYGQVEQMGDQEEFVESTTDLGMQVGLALDIHTPVASIEKMLPYIDGVLLMSVEVGYSGQDFDESVLGKIAELREREFAGDICIDGGLDREAIILCKEKGANHFAVGSTLWNSKNIGKTIEDLKEIK